jgi:hypothetical protein
MTVPAGAFVDTIARVRAAALARRDAPHLTGVLVTAAGKSCAWSPPTLPAA